MLQRSVGSLYRGWGCRAPKPNPPLAFHADLHSLRMCLVAPQCSVFLLAGIPRENGWIWRKGAGWAALVRGTRTAPPSWCARRPSGARSSVPEPTGASPLRLSCSSALRSSVSIRGIAKRAGETEPLAAQLDGVAVLRSHYCRGPIIYGAQGENPFGNTAI